jgi:hypothetical protein
MVGIGVVLLLVWAVCVLLLHVTANGVHLLLIIAFVAFGIRLFSGTRRTF